MYPILERFCDDPYVSAMDPEAVAETLLADRRVE
jgi:hypothetical protein